MADGNVKAKFRRQVGLMSARMTCLGCGEEMSMYPDATIDVNAESKGRVMVPGLWGVWSGCTNPLCEWSKAFEESDE